MEGSVGRVAGSNRGCYVTTLNVEEGVRWNGRKGD